MTFWPTNDDDTTAFTSDGAKVDPDKLNLKESNNETESTTTTTTFSIRLGPFSSARYAEREAEGNTTTSVLPYLAIAGTPLAGLVAGETYGSRAAGHQWIVTWVCMVVGKWSKGGGGGQDVEGR